MTAQATRDALAEMDGWRIDTPTDRTHPAALWWRWNDAHMLKSRTWCRTHPHPPTLDGADAAVTAAGYVWGRGRQAKFSGDGYDWYFWAEQKDVVSSVSVSCTGETLEHKINDLYALALACRKAMEERK